MARHGLRLQAARTGSGHKFDHQLPFYRPSAFTWGRFAREAMFGLADELEVTQKGVVMKSTLLGLGALFLLLAGATLAQADPPYYFPFVRQAPDACGPGYYCNNYCGCVYGPNYCVR